MSLESTLARRRSAHLQQIFWLRNVALAIEAAAIVVAIFGVEIDLPVKPLVVILAAMVGVNIATGLKLARGGDVGNLAILGQILIDVVALSGMLYFTGGSTNPFTVFYLLPLTLSAIMLTKLYLWVVVALAASCYSALLFFHVPLRSLADSHDVMMRLHVFGMWLTFLLSAGLITYFVSRMRDRDIALVETREAMLRNERILAIGAMAAGAAHELGTPLTTIGVLAKEMQDQYSDHPPLVEDLMTLRRQVDACKGTITNLLAAARQNRFDAATEQPVTEFVEEIVGKWRLIRPVVHFKNRVTGIVPAPSIVTDETLGQALMNLLNNAADASPTHVEIDTNWTDEHIVIEVSDRGPGFPEAAIQSAGDVFFSTKGQESGRGLGLFLAKATVERVGGSLTLSRREGSGSVARLMIPFTRNATARP